MSDKRFGLVALANSSRAEPFVRAASVRLFALVLGGPEEADAQLDFDIEAHRELANRLLEGLVERVAR